MSGERSRGNDGVGPGPPGGEGTRDPAALGREEAALAFLRLAGFLLARDGFDGAEVYLRIVLRRFPGSSADTEARRLLDALEARRTPLGSG